jgi:hypothetical protein
LGRFDEIHDFGSGTGHYLDLVAKHSLATNGKCYGYDVSATACEKAKNLFTNYNFLVLDITQSVVSNEQRTTNNEQPARIFMIRGTLWYVFPKLVTVIENIANRMSYPDRLLVVQNFRRCTAHLSARTLSPIISHCLGIFHPTLPSIGIFGTKTA